jgi:hypothetical protein
LDVALLSVVRASSLTILLGDVNTEILAAAREEADSVAEISITDYYGNNSSPSIIKRMLTLAPSCTAVTIVSGKSFIYCSVSALVA